jgi:hypothetical protein
MDQNLRNLSRKRVQCEEIWSFIGARQKNVTPEMCEKNPAERATCGRGRLWMPTPITGNPEPKHISAPSVERQNLTMGRPCAALRA